MNRETKVPLYYQIMEDLRDIVYPLPAGAQIPTEAKLLEKYDVSRGTIRQAIAGLESEGLIVKAQGRGCFRSDSDNEKHSSYFVNKSFTQQMHDAGHETGIENISCVTVPASVNVAMYLGIKKGVPVKKLSRLRTVDGRPFAFGTAFLRADLFPDLKKNDLVLSLTELLRKMMPLTNQKSYCRATLADKKLTDILGVPENTPILQMDMVSYTNGEPALVDIFYFTDSYVLHLETPTIE